MDIGEYGIISVLLIGISIVIIELFLVWIVASTIASFLGVTGIVWWAFAIVIFLIINAIFGALNKIMKG